MHKQYLLAALEQASQGRGLCYPNPSVGAVAVRNGEIIASAFHQGAGRPHAEALIFEQLSGKLDDIVLYVTLEPCNHWGKTPPCVNAIIERGVAEVVYGYKDPNPVVMLNDTPSILAQHGIKTLYLPMLEIDAYYESYRYWCYTKKPFVTAKLAQTLDGKIAQPGGAACRISNARCDQFTHEQRKKTDLILTSAKTVNNDDPLLNARLSGGSYAKELAIIDSHLSLNSQARIFDSAKKLHIYYCDNPQKRLKRENVSYHAVSATTGGLVLEEVISDLGELGYHDVWVEAGATLFQALHRANLVNRTYLYIAPEILGSKAVDAYTGNIMDREKTMEWKIMDDNIMLCIDWKD